jgi:tartrate-resistant acid phosphatase type 5
LKRGTLAAFAASLAAVAALAWLWAGPRRAGRLGVLDEEPPTFGESSVRGARPVPPLAEIAFEGGAPAVSFFAIGDTGWGGDVLRANAKAMQRSAAARPVDFVLLLGDNFYLGGVSSLEDPLWRERFEEPFALFEPRVPFRAVLGNHDHRGDPQIEVEYTRKATRWSMPARWYTFSVPVPGGSAPMAGGGEAQFFALDTQPWKSGWAEASEETSWLEGELSRSRARWKIVFGHHPLLSHGSHGPTEGVAERLGPLLERAGVDLVVSGHDHDLQLLRSKSGWLQLVSGAGSSTRDTSWGDDTLFAAASPGFAWVGLGPDEMWIEIATAAGGPRFRWKVEKR